MTWQQQVGRALFAAMLVAAAACAAAAQKEPERTGGPYVPTPQVVVDQMLRFGNVKADDFVIDLGSGDGVIVLTAATHHKARGFGVDIDADLVRRSNVEAKRRGVADRAQFFVRDVFKTDLSRATVLTLYLLPSMMESLRSKVFLELRPGARVVSHDYQFGEWEPDDSITWDVPEKEAINGVPSATVYRWIVPAKIGGRWTVQVEGAEPFEATFHQNYQVVAGRAQLGARSVEFEEPAVRGEQVSFTLPAAGGRQVFRGRAAGDTLRGTVDLGGGRRAPWTARRNML